MIVNGNRNYELTRSKNLQEPVDIWTDICELTPVDLDDESQDDSDDSNKFGILTGTTTCILFLILFCL